MDGEVYEIRVEGLLGDSWQEWFGGMDIHPEPGGRSLLRGHLEDQSALHGVLNRLFSLNLTLISVRCCGRDRALSEDASNERSERRRDS